MTMMAVAVRLRYFFNLFKTSTVPILIIKILVFFLVCFVCFSVCFVLFANVNRGSCLALATALLDCNIVTRNIDYRIYLNGSFNRVQIQEG